MKLLNQFTAVFEAELRSYVREVGPLAFMAVAPMIFSTLTYGIGSVLTGGAADPEKWFFQLVGFAVMTISIVMTASAAWYFRRGMMSGRLEYVMASPTNPMVLVAANSLANVLVSLLAFVFTALLGSYLVYGVEKILNSLGAVLLTFLALLPVVGVNLMVGALTIAMKEPEPVANSITAVIAATSGFVYPITLLPPILQYIGVVLPYHHVAETARAAITAAVQPSQIIVIALMLTYLIAGLYVYRAGETHYARKTGIHW
ncbi:MAG: ABC transporter permease [Candidatus Caldarchaeum sp.]|nr:ABC transporter permease [Candidatus Caldarchaeum sp.]MDW8436109.1 ABC transporter permease [Candidatus Caldarchaeum sp.]